MYPTEYIQFLIHFHGDYDYFECHEILEEYWKTKPRGNRDYYLVGLIQIAVSLYHQRRANWNGSTKMMKSAITILEKSGVPLQRLGINQVQLLSLLNERLQSIHKKNVFTFIFTLIRSIVREAVHRVMSKTKPLLERLECYPR